MRNILTVSAGALLATGLLAPSLVLSPALAADKVGVAAAVKPEATSQPPGGDTSILRIGKSVVYNERIDTSGSGQVQVLLVDGSTFTVGPGSSLVIDKFVYNPASGRGALVASFSKGALRFVGGKLSKNDPGVKVKTPAGELTVRGGIFTAKISGANKALITFDFGTSLSILRHGQLSITRFAGDVISINGPGAPVIRSQTMADVNATQGRGSRQRLEEDGVSRRQERQAGRIITASSRPAVTLTSPSSGNSYYDGATTGILLNGLTRVPTPTPNIPPIIGDLTHR